MQRSFLEIEIGPEIETRRGAMQRTVLKGVTVVAFIAVLIL